MNFRVVEKTGRTYVELLAGSFLSSEQSAVELVGLCGGAGTRLLMLHEENLSSDFFDLRTGSAGAVLLKFSNYRIRAAVVVSANRIGCGKFYEFVLETNRGRQFYVASDRESAEQWLLDGQ